MTTKRLEVQVCKLCESPIHVSHSGMMDLAKTIPTHGRTGLGMELYFSDGGWGRRREAISFAGEVCDECFQAAKPVYDAIEQYIRDRSGRGESGNKVPPVWGGESSSKGRRTQVLRALPSVRRD